MKQPNFAAMSPAVAKAIEQMMAEQGDKFSLEKINLAELERRTGISRARLRRMKEHGFEDTEHAAKGRRASTTLLTGYTGILDGLLKSGVTNSAVCLSRLRANGFHGGKTIVKDYTLSVRRITVSKMGTGHSSRRVVIASSTTGARCHWLKSTPDIRRSG